LIDHWLQPLTEKFHGVLFSFSGSHLPTDIHSICIGTGHGFDRRNPRWFECNLGCSATFNDDADESILRDRIGSLVATAKASTHLLK